MQWDEVGEWMDGWMGTTTTTTPTTTTTTTKAGLKSILSSANIQSYAVSSYNSSALKHYFRVKYMQRAVDCLLTYLLGRGTCSIAVNWKKSHFYSFVIPVRHFCGPNNDYKTTI